MPRSKDPRRKRSAASWLTAIANLEERFQVPIKKLIYFDFFCARPALTRIHDFDDALGILITPENEPSNSEYAQCLIQIGYTPAQAASRTRGMERKDEIALRRANRKAGRAKGVYKRRAVKC